MTACRLGGPTVGPAAHRAFRQAHGHTGCLALHLYQSDKDYVEKARALMNEESPRDLGGGSSQTWQLEVANRSTNDIGFVAVASEGTTNEFGFLDSAVGHKTCLFGQFRLSRTTSLLWQEAGLKRSATVDTAKYGSERRVIRSLGFTYVGNGTWEVVARSGLDEASPEVRP